MKLKIFLDTNVLLTGFAAYKSQRPLPAYLTDPSVTRYTFEKCVLEAYMAFRGVGGKKPDEGRGDWASRYLKSEGDPSPIDKLASKYHTGDTTLAFFWINQILEASTGLHLLEEILDNYTDSETNDQWRTEIEGLNHLLLENSRYELLCQTFDQFLDEQAVTQLYYYDIFNLADGQHRQVSSGGLHSFAKDTALPSEDFEIVYAALSLPADVFVTDDSRLIRCAMSLGLNYPLSAWNFCKGNEYQSKLFTVKTLNGIE